MLAQSNLKMRLFVMKTASINISLSEKQFFSKPQKLQFEEEKELKGTTGY